MRGRRSTHSATPTGLIGGVISYSTNGSIQRFPRHECQSLHTCKNSLEDSSKRGTSEHTGRSAMDGLAGYGSEGSENSPNPSHKRTMNKVLVIFEYVRYCAIKLLQ